MALSSQQMDEYKQGLMQDVAKAQAQSQAAAQGSGAPVTESFAPRAIRIQNKAVGEREIAQNKEAVNTAIEELLSQTGISNELEQGKFRAGLQQKFNQMRLALIQSANAAHQHIVDQGLDQEKAQAIWAGIAAAASGVGQSAVAGIGKTSPQASGNITAAQIPVSQGNKQYGF